MLGREDMGIRRWWRAVRTKDKTSSFGGPPVTHDGCVHLNRNSVVREKEEG